MDKAAEQNRFPEGWDEDRVLRIIDHYENQTDEEAIAEDEAAFEICTDTDLLEP